MGEALIAFIIEADGTVVHAKVLRATMPEFGEAGVAAVKRWRFRPPTSKKEPVRVRLQVPLTFDIHY